MKRKNRSVAEECEFQIEPNDDVMIVDNRVYLFGTITDKKTENILTALDLLTKDEDTEIIELIIHSDGGDLGGCLSIVDTIKLSSKPIHTYGTGVIASAAVPILAAGEKGHRYAYPNTLLLLHQPYFLMDGKLDANLTKSMLSNANLICDIYLKLFIDCVSPEQLEKITSYVNNGTDLYLETSKMIELGIVDEILRRT